MSDLISRQAAIDAIDEYIENNRRPDFIGNMVWVSGVADARRIVSNLPSVQERKGRWVDCIGSDHWKCSECGDRAPMYWDANRQEYDEWFSPYCPNCGCAMKEGAEDDPEERTDT